MVYNRRKQADSCFSSLYEGNRVLLQSDLAPSNKRANELLIQMKYFGLTTSAMDGSLPRLTNRYFFCNIYDPLSTLELRLRMNTLLWQVLKDSVSILEEQMARNGFGLQFVNSESSRKTFKK